MLFEQLYFLLMILFPAYLLLRIKDKDPLWFTLALQYLSIAEKGRPIFLNTEAKI